MHRCGTITTGAAAPPQFHLAVRRAQIVGDLRASASKRRCRFWSRSRSAWRLRYSCAASRKQPVPQAGSATISPGRGCTQSNDDLTRCWNASAGLSALEAKTQSSCTSASIVVPNVAAILDSAPADPGFSPRSISDR